jgi:dihydrofolate reductase
MRNIVVLEHISIDGVIQCPGGEDEDTSGGFTLGGWIREYSDPILGSYIKTQMALPFDLLLGRKTFEIWESYWPHHGDIWPGVNTATKYVASNSRNSSQWKESVFLSGNIAESLINIKDQEGPDLTVWGSSDLIQTLLQKDLIDEFRLMIYPILLGRGKRLFTHHTPPMNYHVEETTVTPRGVILVNYNRAQHHHFSKQTKEEQ